jgi:hypothetical protein
MYAIHVPSTTRTAYGDKRLYAMVQRLDEAKAVAALAMTTYEQVWVYDQKQELVCAMW